MLWLAAVLFLYILTFFWPIDLSILIIWMSSFKVLNVSGRYFMLFHFANSIDPVILVTKQYRP